jgi:hypothetical protein
MAEQRGNWLWDLLRKKGRKDLDRIECDLVKRVGEKRAFAGDPNQAKHLQIKLKK